MSARLTLHARCFALRHPRWVAGVTWIGRDALKPSWESWGRGSGDGWFGYVNALGFSFWFDSTPPVSVGERGAW